MKHKIKLVKTTETVFEFDGSLAAKETILMEAWHALEEHKIQWISTNTKERLEIADD